MNCWGCSSDCRMKRRIEAGLCVALVLYSQEPSNQRGKVCSQFGPLLQRHDLPRRVTGFVEVVILESGRHVYVVMPHILAAPRLVVLTNRNTFTREECLLRKRHSAHQLVNILCKA